MYILQATLIEDLLGWRCLISVETHQGGKKRPIEHYASLQLASGEYGDSGHSSAEQIILKHAKAMAEEIQRVAAGVSRNRE